MDGRLGARIPKAEHLVAAAIALPRRHFGDGWFGLHGLPGLSLSAQFDS